MARPSPSFPRPSGSSRQALLVCLGLVAAVFFIYGQTLWSDFVNYDDNLYVYDNPRVNQGLVPASLLWAFTSGHAANWHPVTWLSHMVDCQIYGLWAGGHHLTNLLLHAVSAVLLFLILRQMTGALWRSAAVAAIFAVHPLHVESVAWIAERKDVLSGLFFMLTLGAYVRYVRKPSRRSYAWVGVFLALGLMSKPMLVTVPFVLLLLDVWPLQRPWGWALVREKIPLLFLSLVSCLVTVWVQQGAIVAVDMLPVSARLANAAVVYWVYLGQTFWPAGLLVYYPYPPEGWPAGVVAGAVLLLVLITAGVMGARRRWPWLPVGWFWYLGMLVPTIGLVQVGIQAHADRYVYLPQIGLAVAVVWGLAEGWEKKGKNRSWVPMAAAAMVLGLLALLSFLQAGYWKDSKTLWTRALESRRPSALAQNNLGIALEATGQKEEALRCYEEALRIRPDFGNAHGNLGNIWFSMGRMEEALSAYQAAVQFNPRDVVALYDRGIALARLGRPDEAMADYREVLRLEPDHMDALNNLGNALQRQGRADEAVEMYERALQLRPATGVYNNLAMALQQQGKIAEAIECLETALRLDPHNEIAAKNLEDLRAAH